MTRYLVYDVFAEAPFEGNQLAVIPAADTLPEAALQQVAREFNFSETTFVYPPEDPAHSARVRIFTPTMEVPFAGHPTIGTAVALVEAGLGPEMVLELGIGPLPAHAAQGAARFTTAAPLEVLAYPEPALVARALGLPGDRIVTTRNPPVMASVGLPFTLTELADRAALSACRPDTAAFEAGRDAYPGALDFAQYAYVRDGAAVHARMFAPLDQIPEDPATGSAAAALAAYLAQDERPLRLSLRQGEDMGRPSLIGLEADGRSVTVSGGARRIMEGRLLL
ncbi:PhzF family phenazine biosynthesis protein [Rhodosalinus halophilus]|uniref:PhzF family phenazine biosynthesis protein n=1 Tax=Rhodosalinus halophilus TaxID=2259333 RepID=A0A365UDH9_9RHOB|nr:PhzF family phenazine biosynthesis protein [Rhodosalinus halophilus]RBI87551.1 PhzF family phenazine biosynthesis protein [Rhodosalinus halophilus]